MTLLNETMLTLEQLTDFCMDFPGANQDFPFDTKTMVFKISGKMFALINVEQWMQGVERINVKCTPTYALQLREEYEAIIPGYHMNKKHWNTLVLHEGELSKELVFQLIDNSYNLVIQGLSKKERALLE